MLIPTTSSVMPFLKRWEKARTSQWNVCAIVVFTVFLSFRDTTQVGQDLNSDSLTCLTKTLCSSSCFASFSEFMTRTALIRSWTCPEKASGIYSHCSLVYYFFSKHKRKHSAVSEDPSWYYWWMRPHLLLLLMKTCRSVLTHRACTMEELPWLSGWNLCTALTGAYRRWSGSQLPSTPVQSKGYWSEAVSLLYHVPALVNGNWWWYCWQRNSFSEATCRC